MELTEMQRMGAVSQIALEMQTKKNQQLNSRLLTMEQQLARMYGDLDDKDRELATAYAHCTRLGELLEQAQAQLAATSRALNEMMTERDALRKEAKP